MPLTPGTRIGPYEIVAPVGAGGMGEVYKARDTRLDRTVALKFSNGQFSERFEREARAVAALNHPQICTLHDVGPDYLVMEYVDGAPLQGPLPLDQALKYGMQICAALDAAHQKGIAHRDLKPANILVTKAGIKLLDFGLAKTVAAAKAVPEGTVSMALTGKNEIVGTLYYMSPEQLQAQAGGGEIDTRSDIFSFGLVFYEMLTGKRAFDGPSAASVIAAIMERPAPSIADVAPPALDRVLKKCLAKDPDRRWQSARDLKDELEWISVAPASPQQTAAPPPRSGSPARLAFAAAGLLLLAAAVFLWLRFRPAGVPATSARFSIALPPGQEFSTRPVITRDGKTIAYAVQQGSGSPLLYLRDLDSFEHRVVAGSSSATQPFFSPDGKWVAFFAQRQLFKAEVAGGTPVRLADSAFPVGGTWTDDDFIIYTTSLNSGLWRIPAGGGTPEAVTTPDAGAKGYAHTFPQVLPGAKSVLFTVWGGPGQGQSILSLDSRRWELVLPARSFEQGVFQRLGGNSGRLLVVDQASGLRSAPVDVARPAPATVGGTLLKDVYYHVETESTPWLDVSDTRTVVYVRGNPARTSLAWADREGNIEPLADDQDAYRELRLSPDGTKAVVRHGLDFWIHDLVRGTRNPLTVGFASNTHALWSRDGKQIVFGSNRGGNWDIYSQPADLSRPAELLFKKPYDQFPHSISPDGTILYGELQPQNGRDLWTLSPDGNAKPLRVTPFNEGDGRISPNGAWVAYTADDSGRREVYVESYPGGGNRTAVSTGGGLLPWWSPDGKELFYATGDALVAAAFRPDGSFGAPRKVLDRSKIYVSDRYQSYAVTPDSKRLLVILRAEGAAPRQLNVILNWSDDGVEAGAKK
ncbi:MAG TPA: hypothetical protein DEH78_22510 [Solibacterales bacterium]|nr:hypothetical protein [Bryobacterales bacterium]